MASASILWSPILPSLTTIEVAMNRQLSCHFGNQTLQTLFAKRSDWNEFQRCLTAIKQLPLFTSLKLKKSPFILEKELLELLKKTPHLTQLEISWFPLTDLFCQELTSFCTKLERVNFAFCKEITDDSLESLLKLPALTHIDVAGCSKIQGMPLTKAKQGLPLTYLNLNHLAQLSDERLQQILSIHTSLKSLFLGGCKKLTWAAFKNSQLLSLEKLSLASWEILDEELEELATQTPGLTFLNLNQSRGYTWKGLTMALEKWPKLEYLELVSAQLDQDHPDAAQVKNFSRIRVIWSLLS